MSHTPAPSDYRVFYNLSMEFMEPQVAEWAMKKYFRSKMKLQEKTILKDKLICLKDIGTNEVQCFAIKISNKVRYDKNSAVKRTIKYIMNKKIEDILRDIEDEKEVVSREKERLNKVVKPNTIVGKEFNYYVKSRLEKYWKTEKKRIKIELTFLNKSSIRK